MTNRHAYDAWYRSKRWRRLREQVLREQPLCAMCLEREYVEPATVVDHDTPHKGDEALF